MTERPPRKSSPGRRRLYAGLAAGAGLSLVLFELRDLRRSPGIEFYFWLLVGLLLLIFGTIEFLSNRANGPRDGA